MVCVNTPASNSIPPFQSREWRHRWEADRLQKDLISIVSIHPRLRRLQTEQVFARFISDFSLGEAGLGSSLRE
jgi:hypothetical protein